MNIKAVNCFKIIQKKKNKFGWYINKSKLSRLV